MFLSTELREDSSSIVINYKLKIESEIKTQEKRILSERERRERGYVGLEYLTLTVRERERVQVGKEGIRSG